MEKLIEISRTKETNIWTGGYASCDRQTFVLWDLVLWFFE